MVAVDFYGIDGMGRPVNLGRISWNGSQPQIQSQSPAVLQVLSRRIIGNVNGQRGWLTFDQNPEMFLRSLPNHYRSAYFSAEITEGNNPALNVPNR